MATAIVAAARGPERVALGALDEALAAAVERAIAEGRPVDRALEASKARRALFADALRWAVAAGALAVTKLGAAPSIPARSDVQRLLDRVG